MAEGARPPAIVRPAASLLLLRNNPFEVLMVKRNAQSYFASALVFPGGVEDAQDASPDWLDHVDGAEALSQAERASRIAALRETYEEVSILLSSTTATALSVGRKFDLTAPTFFEAVRAAGARLPLDALQPFGHWVTPVGAPKRYDTRFYLCALTTAQTAVCDGGETTSVEWIAPSAALARAASGDRSILFPTRCHLLRLAESPNARSAMAAARDRPLFTVLPVVERTGRSVCVRISAAAGYGVTEDYPVAIATLPPPDG